MLRDRVMIDLDEEILIQEVVAGEGHSNRHKEVVFPKTPKMKHLVQALVKVFAFIISLSSTFFTD